MGAKILPQSPQEQATVALTNTWSKSKFHELTGHTWLKFLPNTAKYMGIQFTGTVNKPVHCALEKIHQANFPKENQNKTKTPGKQCTWTSCQ